MSHSRHADWQLRMLPFLRWKHRVTPATLRADPISGLTVAIVVVPQAMAFASIAGMPPQCRGDGLDAVKRFNADGRGSWRITADRKERYPFRSAKIPSSSAFIRVELPFSTAAQNSGS